MKCEEQFLYLKEAFPDSEIKYIKSNVNDLVTIKYGRLKRVVEFLMDSGVNFDYHDGTVKFYAHNLRMI